MARDGCWCATTCFGGIWAPANQRRGRVQYPLAPSASCLVAPAAGKPLCWPLGLQARSGVGAGPAPPLAQRLAERLPEIAVPGPCPSLPMAGPRRIHPPTRPRSLTCICAVHRHTCTHPCMHRRPASHSQRRGRARRLGRVLPGLICRHGGLRHRREMKKKNHFNVWPAPCSTPQYALKPCLPSANRNTATVGSLLHHRDGIIAYSAAMPLGEM